MERLQPTYALDLVQSLLASKKYRITGAALRGAGELGFDEDDVVSCICELNAAVFYKSMEAERRPGFWQDVYRPTYGGIALYAKVQIEGTSPDDLLVVIQFKRR